MEETSYLHWENNQTGITSGHNTGSQKTVKYHYTVLREIPYPGIISLVCESERKYIWGGTCKLSESVSVYLWCTLSEENTQKDKPNIK